MQQRSRQKYRDSERAFTGATKRLRSIVNAYKVSWFVNFSFSRLSFLFRRNSIRRFGSHRVRKIAAAVAVMLSSHRTADAT